MSETSSNKNTRARRRKVDIIVNSRRYRFDFKKLCAASEYFSTMFNGRFSESNNTEIVLKEVGTKEFKYFHNMLHPTRKVKKITKGLHLQFILELLAFSARFVVPSLVKFCYRNIVRRMETEDPKIPLSILEHSCEYEDDKLKDKVKLWFQCQVIITPIRTVQSVKQSLEETCLLKEEFMAYKETLSKAAYQFALNCIDKHNEYLNSEEIIIVERTKTHKERIKEIHNLMVREPNTRPRMVHYMEIKKLMLEIGLFGSPFDLDFLK